MDNRPNFRMVEVACCGACRHVRYTHEDEVLCVHGLPPAEAEMTGAYRPGSRAATVDRFGLCDAYAPDGQAVAAEQVFVLAEEISAQKLDALTELVGAMAEAIAGVSPAGRYGLGALLARRRGQCEACLGSGGGPSGQSMDGRWGTAPCPACNGTGKAKPEEAAPDG